MMSKKVMEMVGCQFDIAWEDKEKNFKRVRSLLNRRKLSRGSMVVLPEMFATGFSMNADRIAERTQGATTRFMRELARDKGVYVLGGLVRRGSGGRTFNEAVAIAPSGRCIARYAKLHLFSPGDEPHHYSPGADVTMFRWGSLRVALYICYDLRFPEVFRLGARRGADVFVVIASWPSQRQSHWTALLRARAIENQAYVVGVNRCGRDPHLSYAGGSIVFNPRGETVASAGRNETVFSAGLEPAAPSDWRRDFPALQDIRTDFALLTPENPV